MADNRLQAVDIPVSNPFSLRVGSRGLSFLHNETWLSKQYLVRELSIRNIADKLECSPSAVHNALNRFNIPRRHVGEFKHGMEGTPTYRSWAAMKQRCQNPTDPNYPNYGGRGIIVCKRWQVFDKFFEDMGERSEGTTLDRIDNDGDYKPSNCRWATRSQQMKNRQRRCPTCLQKLNLNA